MMANQAVVDNSYKAGESLHILDAGEIFLWYGEHYKVEKDPAEGKCDDCGQEEKKHPCYIPPPPPPSDKRKKRELKASQQFGQFCNRYTHRVYSDIILVQAVEILTDTKGNRRVLVKNGRHIENFNAYWRLKRLEKGIWYLFDDRD